MKKIIAFMTLIITIINISFYSFADIEDEEVEDLGEFIYTSSDVTKSPQISSKYAICIERKTGTILYEKSAYEKSAMASTTKIMTAILAIENCNLKDSVVVSKKAAMINGSRLGLEENMKISLNDLLYGLMLKSGNDAAIAIAEHVSGTVENFAKVMNNKAKDIGMKGTNFVTPNGLDDDNHYSCAYDMAILANYALNNTKFREIVGTKNININWKGAFKNISNTNELLGVYNGVYGVKTGFTFNAGRCLITACKRNDLDIIVVVLNANTKKDRTIDSIRILDYIYTNYQMVDLKNSTEESFENFEKFFYNNVKTYKVVGAVQIEIENKENYKYPIKISDIHDVYIKTYSIIYFSGNWWKGANIGLIRIYCNNKIIDEFKISLKNDLYKKRVKTYVVECLKRLAFKQL